MIIRLSCSFPSSTISAPFALVFNRNHRTKKKKGKSVAQNARLSSQKKKAFTGERERENERSSATELYFFSRLAHHPFMVTVARNYHRFAAYNCSRFRSKGGRQPHHPCIRFV